MQTKYDIGDTVYVKAKVLEINIAKDSKICYGIKLITMMDNEYNKQYVAEDALALCEEGSTNNADISG